MARKTPEAKERFRQYQREFYTKRKDYFKEYAKQNKDRMLLVRNQWKAQLRSRVYDFYGNSCNCCGEPNPMFLTVDHVNNDASLDRYPKGGRRSGSSLYKKIIEAGFPDTYQILCWNCNCGKRINKGICPHSITSY